MAGIPPIDLEATDLEYAAATCLPRELCEKYCVVPVRRFDNTLVVAVTDPPNLLMLDELRFVSSYNIHAVTAPGAAITQAIPRAYKPVPVELPAYLDAIVHFPDDPFQIHNATDAVLYNMLHGDVRFFAIEPGGVWFWRRGRWVREAAMVSDRISDGVIRRLCQIGGDFAPPARDDGERCLITMRGDPEKRNLIIAIANPDGRLRSMGERLSDAEVEHGGDLLYPEPPQHALVPGWPIELVDPYRG